MLSKQAAADCKMLCRLYTLQNGPLIGEGSAALDELQMTLSCGTGIDKPIRRPISRDRGSMSLILSRIRTYSRGKPEWADFL